MHSKFEPLKNKTVYLYFKLPLGGIQLPVLFGARRVAQYRVTA